MQIKLLIVLQRAADAHHFLHAQLGVEDLLAQTDGLGGDLDQLVIGNELDGLLQRKDHGGRQQQLFVGTGGTDGSQLLGLAGVDGDVIVLGVLAHDHALIDLGLRTDEHAAAILGVVQTVAGGLARFGGDQASGQTHLDLTAEGLVAIEDGVEDTLAVGSCQKLGAVAEHAAGGDGVFNAGAAADGIHLQQIALAHTQLFDYGADIFGGNVDGNMLHRLALLTVDLLEENAGVGAADLKAFTAHILQQNGQMHFTAACHAEGVGGITVGHAQGNILEQLLVETLAELTGGDKLTLATCEGAVIDREGHFHGGLADLDKLQRLGIADGGDGITDGDRFSTGEADDITHACGVDGSTAQTVDLVNGNNLGFLGSLLGVVVTDHGRLAYSQRAALNAANTNATDIVIIVDGGYQQLQIARFVSLGSGHIVQDLVEEGAQIGALLVGVFGSGTGSARAIEHGAVELLVVGTQIHQKLQYLILHLVDAGVGLVDLINDNDNTVIQLQRALKDKAGLGHGTLCGVDQQQNAVDHLQNTLNLSAEVSMSRGVYDVDLDILVAHGGVFGEDGDPALTLECVAVHDALLGRLIFAVGAALLEQFIDQGGLTVVNVCDNGDIS